MKHTQFYNWKARITLALLLLALWVPLFRVLRSHQLKLTRGAWARTARSLMSEPSETTRAREMGTVGPLSQSVINAVPRDGTVGVLIDNAPKGRAQLLLGLRILCFPRDIDFYDSLARRYASRPQTLDSRVFVLDATPHRDPFMVSEWKLADEGQLPGGGLYRLLQFQPKAKGR